MAKMNWNRAREIGSIEEKYQNGTVLSNGRVVTNPINRLARCAAFAEQNWLKKIEEEKAVKKSKKSHKSIKHVVIPGLGDRCPRCNRHTQIREHSVITAKHLAQPFYYSRWFYCNNLDCRTNQIMPDEFKVMRQFQETWGD